MKWLECFWNFKREYRVHSLERMVEQNISFEELDEVFLDMELVETYPEDTPFPSCLVLGYTKQREPLHLVYAVDEIEEKVYIITIYKPDQRKWQKDYKRRKK